jgi:hypothetical protein
MRLQEGKFRRARQALRLEDRTLEER